MRVLCASDKRTPTGEPPDSGVAMRGDRIGMSHTYRFTAASYDNFPASEWASPRFVMVSLKQGRRAVKKWLAPLPAGRAWSDVVRTRTEPHTEPYMQPIRMPTRMPKRQP
jgi:hypothetical protein